MSKVRIALRAAIVSLFSMALLYGCGNAFNGTDKPLFHSYQNGDQLPERTSGTNGDSDNPFNNGNVNGSNNGYGPDGNVSDNGNGYGPNGSNNGNNNGNNNNNDSNGPNDGNINGNCDWIKSSSSKYRLKNLPNGPNLDPAESNKTVKQLVDSGSGYWDGDEFHLTFKTYQVKDSAVAPDDFGEFLQPPEKRYGVADRANRTERTYNLSVTDANSDKCDPQMNLTNQDFDNPGCFDENTKIRMSDGKQKIIKKIRKGDLVYNPVIKKSFPVNKVSIGYEYKPLIEVAYGKFSVKVTYNHPFLTAQGVKMADKLQLTDRVIGADGKFHKLHKLKTLPLVHKQIVANVSLDSKSDLPTYHMIEADGVVSGDLFLQEKMAKKEIHIVMKR